MKLLKPLSLLTFLLIFTHSYSQDSKVIRGVILYDSGDYEKAIETLESALNSNIKKEKTEVKGHLYLGKSIQHYILKNNDSKYLFQDAYEEMMECNKFSLKSSQESDLKQALLGLRPFLFSEGVKLNVDKNYSDAIVSLHYTDVIDEFYGDGPDYLLKDMLSMTFLNDGDTLNSIDFGNEAIEVFQSSPPETPSINIAFTYYRLAFLERLRMEGTNEKSLEIIKSGIKVLNSENDRFKKENTVSISEYESTLLDLELFMLDTYKYCPEYLEEALEAYDLFIKKHPVDLNVRLAYAELVSLLDPEAGIAEYDRIIDLDSENEIANFNAGVYFYTLATDYYSQSINEEDFDKVGDLEEKRDEAFIKAKPYFEKVIEVNEFNNSALGALKTIALTLGFDEDYQRYKEIESRQ